MTTPVLSLQTIRVNDKYEVITITSPVGQPQSQLLPIYTKLYQKEAVMLALEAAKFKPAEWQGEGRAEFFQALKELHLANDDGFTADLSARVGGDLFAAMFTSSGLKEALHATINKSSPEEPARIEFRFSEQAVDLAAYPWELLYEPERNFLFSNSKASLVRYITCNLPTPELLESKKLRLLLVSARPIDPLLQWLPGTEKAAIMSAQADSMRIGSIQADILPMADSKKSTWDILSEWLINHKGESAPHIFHFDGHGGFGKLCQNQNCGKLNRAIATQCAYCSQTLAGNEEGYLAFEKTDKGSDWISANKLANLLGGFGVRLAFLSACKSGVMGGKSVFNGMAAALIKAGIPGVVAMQFSIDDYAAQVFTKIFYQSLSNGDPLVVAISQARAHLFNDQTAWYRPVLYLRTDESNPNGKLLKDQHIMPSVGLSIDPPERILILVVNLLLTIPSVSNNKTRDDIVNLLPKNISNSIRRNDSNKADVMSILRTCRNYPNGLIQLIEAIEFFEEDSIPFRNLNKELHNMGLL